jgi:membrane protease subunit (stomatin/prohibitin family)
MNGSLLTVESNHFCVLKSRGAILNVYETGQYPVETPQREPFNYGITSFAAMPGLDSRGAAATAPQAQHNSAG